MKTLKESLFNDNVKSQIPVNLKSTKALVEKLLLKNRLSKEGRDSFCIYDTKLQNEFKLELSRKIYKRFDGGPGSFYNEEVRSIELVLFFVQKDTYVKAETLNIDFNVYPIDTHFIGSSGWFFSDKTWDLHYDKDIYALIDELIKYYDKAGEFLKSKELNNELLKSSSYQDSGKLTPRENQQTTKKAAKYMGIPK